MNVLFKRPL